MEVRLGSEVESHIMPDPALFKIPVYQAPVLKRKPSDTGLHSWADALPSASITDLCR